VFAVMAYDKREFLLVRNSCSYTVRDWYILIALMSVSGIGFFMTLLFPIILASLVCGAYSLSVSVFVMGLQPVMDCGR
jgi:hypothetical protein